MKKEYELILKTVVINKSEEEKKEITSLLEQEIDWVEIAGVLLSHRLGGYFYMGLTEEQREFIPSEIRIALELLVSAQKTQQMNINNVINEINKELEKTPIHYAFLKGSLYGCTMYELGSRRSNDVDILVYENDLELLDDVMRKMGYIQSNLPDGKLIAATKKEKMIQRMNYHDLVPYVKQFEFGLVEIDINFLFDGKDNTIDDKVYQYGTENYSGNDISIVGLKDYTNMAFLCSHFYREATNTLWTAGKRDLLLYKIVDMINFIRFNENNLDIDKSIQVFVDLNLVRKVYFSFKILKEFYDNKYINQVFEELSKKVDDDSFMKEIYDHKSHSKVHREESFCDASFKLNHV